MKWLVRDHCRVYRSHTKWLVVLVLLGLIGSCETTKKYYTITGPDTIVVVHPCPHDPPCRDECD